MSLLFTSFILGVVQALTEFLPISSSGHLILIKEFLHFDPHIFDLSFDIILHAGSLLALVLFFRKDLVKMIKSLFSRGSDNKLLYSIVIATFPAVIFALLFSNLIENNIRSGFIVSSMLILGGIFLLLAEKISKKTKELKNIKFGDAAVIGGAQSLALIPGISRSGSTIVSALFLGFKRDEAARFSFLLSIPVIFLASTKDIFDIVKQNNLTTPSLDIYVVGFITSFIFSFIVIKFLLEFLKNHTLKVFAYYRFVIAALFLLIFVL